MTADQAILLAGTATGAGAGAKVGSGIAAVVVPLDPGTGGYIIAAGTVIGAGIGAFGAGVVLVKRHKSKLPGTDPDELYDQELG